MQVNPSLTLEKLPSGRREQKAENYAACIGKILMLLRADVEISWIHRGRHDFGHGNDDLLIYTGRGEQCEKRSLFSRRPGQLR